MEKEYYIKLEGEAGAVLAVAHVKANNEEDAVQKAKEAYTARLWISPISEAQAKDLQHYDGVDIINEDGEPEIKEIE